MEGVDPACVDMIDPNTLNLVDEVSVKVGNYWLLFFHSLFTLWIKVFLFYC